ncbi:TIR domain-containing protein [Bartonella grahamii]|uniref:TIR domain-containing protein n=1 Tax=Bartonella grahamii TaxID=33045 RepID=UPI00235EAE18|nr:TIR domain-containing protein [Bartonella grahamii]
MQYSGTLEDLTNIICKAGYQIKETKPLSHPSPEGYQIKTSEGGTINWYKSTGKLQVQGSANIKQKLTEDLAKHLEETSTIPSSKTASNPSNKKIFIVHGHDRYALKELENVLLKLGLEPYILQNTSGNGLPIIQTLKKEICDSSISFGIVLLTHDDMGYAISQGAEKIQPRARQNVIFEMGMLAAALPLERIAILQKEGIEMLSDVGGVYYLSFKEQVNETFPKLITRLGEADFSFNTNTITRALN